MPTIRRRRHRPAPAPAPEPEPAPIPNILAVLAKPGRPYRETPRDLHLPGLPPNTTVNVGTRILPTDAPRPRCVWPGCLNAAMRAGTQPAEHTFTTRWRAWCYRHRPSYIRTHGLDRPTRPRYSALNPIPADRPICQVPGCGRPTMLKTRNSAGRPRYKRFCQRHNVKKDEIPDHLRQEGCAKKSVSDFKESQVARVRTAGKEKSRVVQQFDRSWTVTIREPGGSYTWTVPPADIAILRAAQIQDIGAWAAGTLPNLSKKYPTTVVTLLFAKWRTS